VTVAGGALGLLALLISPASACLPDGGGDSGDSGTPLAEFVPLTGLDRDAPAVAPLRLASATVAQPDAVDPVTLLQAKLDRIAARTARDTAQWSGTTALAADQLRPAVWDLWSARRALAWLAAVDAADRGTAAQQAQVDALQASVGTLATHLRALLATAEPALQARSVKYSRDGWGERDRTRDGWGYRSRTSDRSDGYRSAGYRSGGDERSGWGDGSRHHDGHRHR
jgi:hypothetical protein